MALKINGFPAPEEKLSGRPGYGIHYPLRVSVQSREHRWGGDRAAREYVVRRHNPEDAVMKMCAVADTRPLHPTDVRAAVTGEQLWLPRSCSVTRYLVPLTRQTHRAELATLTDFGCDPHSTEGFGPLGSKIAVFADDEPAPRGPGLIGCWSPASEDGSPTPGQVGGAWITPYTGESNAAALWAGHCRVMDRCTPHLFDERGQRTLADLLDGGFARSERYSLQARGNPLLSILPDGIERTTPEALRLHPLTVWQSTCGNGGYDGAHLIRQVRHAVALASRYPTLAPFVAPDIEAMAHDVTFWLSTVRARDGGTGENPYWMLRQSLYYRPRGPQGIVRDLGGAFYVGACGLRWGTERTDALASWAHEALDYYRLTLMPSGFNQAARNDQIGPPFPSQHGVPANVRVAQEIEAPIMLHGAVCLAAQLGGDLPAWLVETVNKVATAYLDAWGDGEQPRWPKWWVVERDGKALEKAEPWRKEGTPESNVNGWLVLELGYRYGSQQVRDRIEKRRAAIKAAFEASYVVQPWAAGIVGVVA